MFCPMKLFVAVSLLCMPLMSYGQTENPRGIYKMVTLTGKVGEIKAPFDQYKICTDSGTIMVSIQKNVFKIGNTDHMVFNYTGDQPKTENDHSSLIYDSNSEHFTLKWWSENKAHLYFPDHGWCIEKYESGKYSEAGKVFFDALTGVAEVDATNPLTGTWRVIGYVDELRDIKKNLPSLHEKYATSKYFNSFAILSPKNWTMATPRGGIVEKVEFLSKKSFKIGSTTHQVKWLTKDRIAIDDIADYRIDWIIVERVTDGICPLSRIASQYISNRRR